MGGVEEVEFVGYLFSIGQQAFLGFGQGVGLDGQVLEAGRFLFEGFFFLGDCFQGVGGF